jgi:protein SCO1/2
MNRRRCVVPLLALAAVFAAPAASARSQSLQTAGSSVSIPDVELVDQHGRKLHFYSDLVKGKVVAINTVFTTCTTICPLMGAKFSRLSRMLGDEGHGKVNLISISVDPETDTPERLDAWSREFGEPGADWTLVTGAKNDVDTLLKALQTYTADKQEHLPVVLIGDGTGGWARASALLPPSQLADLLHARLQSASGRSAAGH